MAVVPGDKTKPTIWEEYRKIIRASGEKALYANIILKKGVL